MIEKHYVRMLKALGDLKSWSVPRARRLLRFAALPWCYFSLVDWNECTASRLRVVSDFLYIFFVLKTFPDNYSACRFWEKKRDEWARYYGSAYDPYQRARLQREVQRPQYEILFADKDVCSLLLAEAGLPADLGRDRSRPGFQRPHRRRCHRLGPRQPVHETGDGIGRSRRGDDRKRD